MASHRRLNETRHSFWLHDPNFPSHQSKTTKYSWFGFAEMALKVKTKRKSPTTYERMERKKNEQQQRWRRRFHKRKKETSETLNHKLCSIASYHFIRSLSLAVWVEILCLWYLFLFFLSCGIGRICIALLAPLPIPCERKSKLSVIRRPTRWR